uniref:heme ABC exporter ATP-binding protein CcmA n=1 Tax=Stappia sp. TaxID=1870903 RepID=UPI003BABFAAB
MRLIAENLACERGGRRVLGDVSLEVAAGEALAVTGPNGVGKSTLIRVIAGLVASSEGRVSLEGGEDDLSVCEHCHYFGHLDALKPALSVRENLAFWRAFMAPVAGGLAPLSDLDEALDRLGIAHTADLPAAYLSAGQKRRLSVARLLVVSRPVWLLDEPTSALDAASEAGLLAIMTSHLEAGGLIVAATHQPLALAPLRHLALEAAE